MQWGFCRGLEAIADECGTVIGSMEVLEHLSNISRDESIPAGNRIRALELLGEYHNLFTERVQFGMAGEFAHLPNEQLEEEILALGRIRPEGWTPDTLC